MRVVGFMSGSGSNLRKILDFERQLQQERGKSPYKMVCLFSDTYDSKANEIGRDYDLPVITRDIRSFYKARGKPRKDMEVRKEFDAETVSAISRFEACVAAYGGYMSIASERLIHAFTGVNVHPADLSVMQEGKRKYTGDHAVRDAILAGEKYIHSTTHLIEPVVDGGKILMISSPLEVMLEANFDPQNRDMVARAEKENQNRLKEAGDWVIFPKTLLHIAEGRYAIDAGSLYFDELLIPMGIKLN